MVTRTEISAAYWRAIKGTPRYGHKSANALRRQRIDSWLLSCETELEKTFGGSAIMRDDPADRFRRVNHG